MASALIIIANGCEEIEYITVADILVRAGHKVTIATDGDTQITGSRGLPLSAQCQLQSLTASEFDLVYLPGGVDQAQFCSDNTIVQSIIGERLASKSLLAIICASPLALLPQKLATGRRITSYPAMREDLEAGGAEWIDQAVVVDDQLITSQGPGTAMELALWLVRILGDTAKEQEIREQLLAPARQ